MVVRSVIQSVIQPVITSVVTKFGGGAAEFIRENAIVNLDGTGIASSSGVITEWTNSGTGGSAFDLDVILGTGANLKPHPSGSALFYGAAGDFISTPDSAAASVTGSAIFYGLIKPTDSTPGGLRTIVSKWTESGNLRSYRFSLDNSPSGGLQLNLSANGSTNEAIDATEGTGFANDTIYWTFAAYNASVPELVFRTLEGNESLTPAAAFALSNKLGDSVPCVATSIDDNGSAFEVGSINVGVSSTFPGAIFKAGVIAGTDPTATPAVSFNASDGGNKTGVASDTFVSSETGETYTLHGNTFIQNTGHTSINSIGSAGLETTAGQTINTPMTIFMVAKPNVLTGSSSVFFAARAAGSSSPKVRGTSTAFTFNAGATIVIGDPDTDLHLHTVRHNGDPTSKYEVDSIGSVTGDAGAENFEWGTLFTDVDISGPLNGAQYQYIIIPFATDDAVTESIEAYLLNKFGI